MHSGPGPMETMQPAMPIGAADNKKSRFFVSLMFFRELLEFGSPSVTDTLRWMHPISGRVSAPSRASRFDQ